MVNENFADTYEIDIQNLTDIVKVPISDEDTGETAFYMMLARDELGFIGYWLELEDGRVAVDEPTDEELHLFEQVVAHVGWA